MTLKTLLIAGLAGCMQAHAQINFKIQGTVHGMADSTILKLVNTEGAEPKVIAEATATGGRFTLAGTARYPYLCVLRAEVKGKKEWNTRKGELRLMLDTEPITISTDTATFYADRQAKLIEQDVNVEGGRIIHEYRDFLGFTRQKDLAADSASFASANAWFKNNGDDEAVKEYKQRADEAKRELTACQETWFKAHPQAFPTAAMLAQRIYKDFTYTADEYDGMAELVKQNPDTAHANFINRNLALAKQFAIGARYTDFEGKMVDNTMSRLSSHIQEGKFTLIDFWASWCGPCRAAIPKVKTMAAKHAERLAVVSVSVDEKEAAWRKAEAAEGMDWPQMLLLKDGMEVAGSAYRIVSIPRLVLISPEGTVLAATHDPAIIETTLKENIK